MTSTSTLLPPTSLTQPESSRTASSSMIKLFSMSHFSSGSFQAVVSHLVAFGLGGIVTLLVLAIGVLYIFKKLPERVPPLKRGFKRGKGAKTPSDSGSYGRSVSTPTPQFPADTDPKLTKFGWIRVSTRPLTIDELYRDQNGLDTDYFLGDLGTVGPTCLAPQMKETRVMTTVSPRRKQNLIASMKSMTQTAFSIVEASLETSSYLVSRFMGEKTPLPQIAANNSVIQIPTQLPASLNGLLGSQPSPPPAGTVPDETLEPSFRPPWKDFFVILKHKSLFLYQSDDRLECLDVVLLPEYSVDLYPFTTVDRELYRRDSPIRLRHKSRKQKKQGSQSTNEDFFVSIAPLSTRANFYIYAMNGFEKENWYLMLRRASKLNILADSSALSAQFEESEEYRQFYEAMEKLAQSIKRPTASPKAAASSLSLNGSPNQRSWSPSTAWLNAFVGRVFVGLHSNPKIKEWIMGKINSRISKARGASILGDIIVQEVSVGNSLPVISNPKLVDFSLEGDLNIEFDIDYTGGFRVEAGTIATISGTAWEAYFKPVSIPLVVAICMKRFSARVLIKVKPFWETSRFWVGLYKNKPEPKIELEIEPIISNKLIKLQLVNQIVEQRIKAALEEFLILPNMDDIGFWSAKDGSGGLFWDDTGAETDVENDYEESESDENAVDFADSEGEALKEYQSAPLPAPKIHRDTVTETEYRSNSVPELSTADDCLAHNLDVERIIQSTKNKLLAEAVKANEMDDLWIQQHEGPSRVGDIDSSTDNLNAEEATPQVIATEIEQQEDPGTDARPQITTPFSQAESDTDSTWAAEKSPPSPTASVASSSTSLTTRSVFEFLGGTAEYAGRMTREYKLDEVAKNLSTTAATYSQTLKEQTGTLSNQTLAYFGYAPIRDIKSFSPSRQEESQHSDSRDAFDDTDDDLPDAKNLLPARPATSLGIYEPGESQSPSPLKNRSPFTFDHMELPYNKPRSRQTSPRRMSTMNSSGHDASPTDDSNAPRRNSTLFNMLGVNISTTVPSTPPPTTLSPTTQIGRRSLIKKPRQRVSTSALKDQYWLQRGSRDEPKSKFFQSEENIDESHDSSH